MKSKHYWADAGDTANPFDLAKRVSTRLSECAERAASLGSANEHPRYIWLYLTRQGLSSTDSADRAALSIDDWLAIVDESAAMGAEWMIVHVGTSLAESADVNEICKWAQDTHGLKVGLHLAEAALTDSDLRLLAELDQEKTFIVADRDLLPRLQQLRDQGVHVCESNVKPEERPAQCCQPESITCVDAGGRMFSCGLVLGDERYDLGEALGRSLREVAEDGSLPHRVADTDDHPIKGCSACPPVMAKRLEEQAKS